MSTTVYNYTIGGIYFEVEFFFFSDSFYLFIHKAGNTLDMFGDRDTPLEINRGKFVDVEVEATHIDYTEGFAELDFGVREHCHTAHLNIVHVVYRQSS